MLAFGGAVRSGILQLASSSRPRLHRIAVIATAATNTIRIADQLLPAPWLGSPELAEGFHPAAAARARAPALAGSTGSRPAGDRGLPSSRNGRCPKLEVEYLRSRSGLREARRDPTRAGVSEGLNRRIPRLARGISAARSSTRSDPVAERHGRSAVQIHAARQRRNARSRLCPSSRPMPQTHNAAP